MEYRTKSTRSDHRCSPWGLPGCSDAAWCWRTDFIQKDGAEMYLYVCMWVLYLVLFYIIKFLALSWGNSSPLMEIKNNLQQMCVGVIFYFLLSLMFFHLQEKLKKKRKSRPRPERRKTKLCWQNERSVVKTGAFCSINVLSQQWRRPLSECQLVLLSHQILQFSHQLHLTHLRSVGFHSPPPVRSLWKPY